MTIVRPNVPLAHLSSDRHFCEGRRALVSPELGRVVVPHVVILAFPGVNLLDIAGPAQVFTSAAELHSGTNGLSEPAYSVTLASEHGVLTSTTSGLEINSVPISSLDRPPIDTLLIAGGHGSEAAGAAEEILGWLRTVRPRVRRMGSICTGAFVLAAAGLAEGRRLATHWAYCDRLQELHPGINVERDAIFIEDGGLWSSAGISSGVDLALALVEQDYGRELALMVARRLVVFLQRSGGQSQFSMPLAAQLAEGPLAALPGWVTDNPAADYRIEKLAQLSNMSLRTFHRLFRDTFERSPAQWIRSMRVECARRLLEQSEKTLQEVSAASGLGSADAMRRIFLRQLGVTPSNYRARFHHKPSYPSPELQHALSAARRRPPAVEHGSIK
jgi:transcriptional regulator GlxA family with amidase domain